MAVLDRIRNWYFSYGFLVLGVGLVAVTLINSYALFGAKQGGAVTDSRPGEELKVAESCGEDCVRQLVGEAVATLSAKPAEEEALVTLTVAVATPTPTKAVTKSYPTPTPGLKTYYLRLNDVTGAGVEFVSVGTGKWLDTSLYGQLESATWEGGISLPGGSGEAFARLWDATNDRAVDGSEVKIVDTQTTSFYSGNISLWRGQNQYFIQVKVGDGQVAVTQPQIKLMVR